MTNEIYIPNELSETLKGLSKDQKREVVQTIDRLGEDVLDNSYIVPASGPSQGDLREARAGGLRVLFRYLPESNSVIIAEVSSVVQEKAMASSASA